MKTKLAATPSTVPQDPPQNITIDWNQIEQASCAVPTLQVVVNPPLRRGSPIHDRVFSELRQLQADYVRYVPWLPYPRLAVAELEPPSRGKTHWDFSLIDPLTVDFLEATRGHPVVMDFSVIPAWLFRTPKRVPYPLNPDQPDWNYGLEGTELRDPSLRELGAYFARLISWYTRGGFVDELGRRHVSGHHYKFDYWEVLNEADAEHKMTPEQYTKRYDAIVWAIKAVAPKMKFVGISMWRPSVNPRMFEYFLDPKNHRPGTPLDMISYHFYATPSLDQSPEVQCCTFFDQADRFIATARYIEAIRERLSPSTGTMVNEVGSILADDHQQGMTGKNIPASYWNLSGALFAYLFGHLATLGIKVVGASQLVGYPSQFPSVSLVDWTTGAPNARFRVLELIKDHFGPGDRIVSAAATKPAYVYTYAVITAAGIHKVLVVNKRDREFQIMLPQIAREARYVDQTTGAGSIRVESPRARGIRLPGLAVAVVTLAGEKETKSRRRTARARKHSGWTAT